MYWRNLWRTELATAICLAVVLLLLAYVWLGFVYAWVGEAPDVFKAPRHEQSMMFLSFAIFFGAPPALLVFAPVYAYLRTRNQNTLARAVVCGALAAMLMGLAFFNHVYIIATVGIPSAMVVASMTHGVMKIFKTNVRADVTAELSP